MVSPTAYIPTLLSPVRIFPVTCNVPFETAIPTLFVALDKSMLPLLLIVETAPLFAANIPTISLPPAAATIFPELLILIFLLPHILFAGRTFTP